MYSSTLDLPSLEDTPLSRHSTEHRAISHANRVTRNDTVETILSYFVIVASMYFEQCAPRPSIMQIQ